MNKTHHHSEASKHSCWQCGEGNEPHVLQCSGCDHLQPPVTNDPFEIFELEPAFEIDENGLEKSYLAMQQQVHPDCYATASAKEQRFATAHSLAINEAYETLKTPLGRAEYLLAQQGLIVNRDGRDSVKASQMLLMESLEAREKLENAKESVVLRAMQQEVKQQRKECLEKLSALFEAKHYQDAAQETIRLKYLLKLEQEIKDKKRK